ncbi:hypothetical protein [Bacteroides bouchesdurhonensis]|uniref:hypothetical protein n=1 Tax=Bacteroides bouchesdurhonensis TaxID=1841855 RepID=UPI00097F6CCA|nr:hypothetical protein [Bacteroides bouchesdurhonensis]
MKNILLVKKEEVRDENFHLPRLNFPFQGYELVPSYTFSYQVYHTNGGYANTYDGNSTSYASISEVLLPKIGEKGGNIEISVRCTDTETDDYSYVVKNLSYPPSENTIDVAFYMTDFYFNNNDNDLLKYKHDLLNKRNN